MDEVRLFCREHGIDVGVGAGDDEPAVAPERFHAAEPGTGHWVAFPQRWENLPEERVLSAETRARLAQAIAALAPTRQAVIILRDVEGWTAEEVCRVVGVSAAQRATPTAHHAVASFES